MKWPPSSLSSMFQKTNEVHEYQTRQAKHDFLPPMPKTNCLKKAFSYRGAVAWNNLPTAIKNSESINIFKTKLKDSKKMYPYNVWLERSMYCYMCFFIN